MRWLAECSAEALGEALRVVAPELSGYPVTVPVPDPDRVTAALAHALPGGMLKAASAGSSRPVHQVTPGR
jgi:hypothetical protein